MWTLALVIGLALALPGCSLQTRASDRCAEAIEGYARSLDAFKEEQTEHRKAMQALSNSLGAGARALDATAEAADAQAAKAEKIIEYMKTWECSPRGLPQTQLPPTARDGGG